MYLNTVFKYNVFKYCPALTSVAVTRWLKLSLNFESQSRV